VEGKELGLTSSPYRILRDFLSQHFLFVISDTPGWILILFHRK
jgi:hypothetical protein